LAICAGGAGIYGVALLVSGIRIRELMK
jgi:hypothetical protein